MTEKVDEQAVKEFLFTLAFMDARSACANQFSSKVLKASLVSLIVRKPTVQPMMNFHS